MDPSALSTQHSALPRGNRAVFLDRDGTIIADSRFVSKPSEVHLIPGAAEAIRAFRDAGFKVVVASNQSGVARGLFDESAVRAVNDRVQAELRDHGAEVDAFYFCPYLDAPEAVVEDYRRPSDWRKPEPGMLLAAADDLHLDLRRSWMIGDAARDVQAGRRAGCRTVLIAGAAGNGDGSSEPAPNGVAASLAEAAEFVLSASEGSTASEQGSGFSVQITEPRPSGSDSLPATPMSDPSAMSDSRVLALLTDIRDLLDRSLRRERQADFSLPRLAATLLQMLAAASGVWGLATLLGGQSADATPRLLLACFLLLASMAITGADRQR